METVLSNRNQSRQAPDPRKDKSRAKEYIDEKLNRTLDAFPFGSASQLARALRVRKVSSVELLKAYLARFDRLNPSINAVFVDDRERAMAQALAADRARARGKILGPLHGVPMTV